MTLGNEQYTSSKPNRLDLQSYIAYYYFDFSTDKSGQKKYIFYPHYRNTITVYKNSDIKFSENSSHVVPDKNISCQIIYTGIQLESRLGLITSPFEKIGIVFQPLGINNFIKEPLSAIISENPKSNFNYFGSEFNSVLDQVYNTNDIVEKVNLLDAFFYSKLNIFKEDRLIKAVDVLFQKDLSIQSLCEDLSLNRKMLFRLFKKHIMCSPKEFSNVLKFRKALNLYQSQENKPQLTQLAYTNAYYDQSDFIKHFKKVTGFNPKKFFANISHLGSEDTFWTLLEN